MLYIGKTDIMFLYYEIVNAGFPASLIPQRNSSMEHN